MLRGIFLVALLIGEVHAVEAGDEGERNEDGGHDGEHAPDLVGADADAGE